jgi:sulfatase modifying factor 1
MEDKRQTAMLAGALAVAYAVTSCGGRAIGLAGSSAAAGTRGVASDGAAAAGGAAIANGSAAAGNGATAPGDAGGSSGAIGSAGESGAIGSAGGTDVGCGDTAPNCFGSDVQQCCESSGVGRATCQNGQWICSGVALAPGCNGNSCLPPSPPPPSCVGLAATCGPNGDQDCCASNVVPGGSFYRSYDGVTEGYKSMAYPATVSDFRLDTYEVTVGRFRKFVAAYSQNMIAQGAGKNPNNSSDPGWDTSWNTNLEATPVALTAGLKGEMVPVETWTDAAGTAEAESLPITGLDWFHAEAFCIWDGGRLPTEAEWNYAAAGGTQQRVYPWGSTAPDCSYATMGGCVLWPRLYAAGVTRVGLESPKGDGLFGQADLAGNVWEWVQDEWLGPIGYYVLPCNDCANMTSVLERVARGGSSDESPLPGTFFLSSSRRNDIPSDRTFGTLGARCARAASSKAP